MIVQPLSNYVIVRPVEAKTQTQSGLLLPESSAERPNQGQVMAVGEGLRNEQGNIIPMSVRAGDIVLFQKYAGVEIKLEGIKLLIMRETDLLGIVKDAK